MVAAAPLRPVGSSDVAGILGESPWSSPWSVWSRLVGLTERTYGDTSPDTEDGHMLESGILLRYQREHQAHDMVPGPPVEAPAIVRPDAPWMSCHPDGLRTQARVIIEAKAPRTLQTDEWGPSGSTHAPRMYLLQCVWLMAVIGYDRTDLVAFARRDREDRWRIYPLTRRAKLEASIVGRVRDWYDEYVLGGKPPPIDGTDACAQALARMHLDVTPRTWKEATAADLALARDLLAVRQQLEQLTTEKVRLENELRARIGDDYGLRAGDRHVATHGVTRGRALLDIRRLRQERPDIAAAFAMNSGPSRRFTFPFDPKERA